MRSEEVGRYKKQLLDLRDRSRVEISRMIKVVLEEAEVPGEHDHKVSESMDKEVVLENTEEGIHNAVRIALQRIDDGAFGHCADCGVAIDTARLDAIPFTPYCVECARQHEDH